MEDEQRYRDYLEKLISRRQELEIQFDDFIIKNGRQLNDKMRYFIKRNEGFQEFEQEFGFKVIAGLGLSPIYLSCAYSDYVLQFTRLHEFYSNLIGLYPIDME